MELQRGNIDAAIENFERATYFNFRYIQAFANLGVVTGLLPPKGVGLPFISYGGSNLVLCLASVGILLSLHRQAQYREEARSRRLVGGRR